MHRLLELNPSQRLFLERRLDRILAAEDDEDDDDWEGIVYPDEPPPDWVEQDLLYRCGHIVESLYDRLQRPGVSWPLVVTDEELRLVSELFPRGEPVIAELDLQLARRAA